MQKIIKVDKKVIVLFEDGSYCEKEDVSKEELTKIVNSSSDEEIYLIMNPEFADMKREYINIQDLINNIHNSEILTMKGDSVYWEEISRLSLPPELVKAIIEAEEKDDKVRIDTYRNFWTLMSLNPDEECRKNLFWFLNRNGLSLSKHGFFVAYRNVDTTNEEGVYTDHHSHTFRIKVGEMVTLPREQCDCNSNNECSRGLICSPVY